jgi:hypothetical protein
VNSRDFSAFLFSTPFPPQGLVPPLHFRTSSVIFMEQKCADIGLTELTKHAILSYPLPDQQKGEKFSAFTYLHNDAHNPICGTAHNVASPEMLYISGSSGAHFDQAKEALAYLEKGRAKGKVVMQMK